MLSRNDVKSSPSYEVGGANPVSGSLNGVDPAVPTMPGGLLFDRVMRGGWSTAAGRLEENDSWLPGNNRCRTGVGVETDCPVTAEASISSPPRTWSEDDEGVGLPTSVGDGRCHRRS